MAGMKRYAVKDGKIIEDASGTLVAIADFERVVSAHSVSAHKLATKAESHEKEIAELQAALENARTTNAALQMQLADALAAGTAVADRVAEIEASLTHALADLQLERDSKQALGDRIRAAANAT